jgi:hypothetical protein
MKASAQRQKANATGGRMSATPRASTMLPAQQSGATLRMRYGTRFLEKPPPDFLIVMHSRHIAYGSHTCYFNW